MDEPLTEEYVAQAMRDARRFQHCWDQGTSGALAAHTARLVMERGQLMKTIDDLRGQGQADSALEEAWEAHKRRHQETQDHIRRNRVAYTAAGTVPDPRPRGFRLIGVTGRAGSGKTSVAGMVPRAVVMQLADPLYAAISTMLGIPEPLLRQREFKERPIGWLGKSPRQLLQTLGTEWGRDTVREDVWLEVCRRRIEVYRQAGAAAVVIADVRFENEAAMVRDHGELWHVIRPGGQADDHASERGVSVREGDREILNNGTLADLRGAVAVLFDD